MNNEPNYLIPFKNMYLRIKFGGCMTKMEKINDTINDQLRIIIRIITLQVMY